MELLLEHLGRGLMLSLVLSLPAVLMAASIGLVVGILQAVTQVQEQTIAAAPKILGVFMILLIGGGLMMTLLEDYVRESFQIAFNEIPQDGVYILPAQTRRTPQATRRQHFFGQSDANRLTPTPGRLESLKTTSPQMGMDKPNGQSARLKIPGQKVPHDAFSLSERMTLNGKNENR
jgi:flagellar biosynthesis protein FliQ